jgi:hypothetical protein
MATTIYPIIEQFVDDAWAVLDRDKLTPWAFFNAGSTLTCTDFYGAALHIGGHASSDQDLARFWSTKYIPRFLEDIADRGLALAASEAAKRDQPVPAAIEEASGLLISLSMKTFARMATIDRRLRGNGFPQDRQIRPTSGEVTQMKEYIQLRAATERPASRSWWDRLYTGDHFWRWAIGLLASIALGLISLAVSWGVQGPSQVLWHDSQIWPMEIVPWQPI